MASPLIVDDGGSTRIKHFRLPPSNAVGAMDGLLDVQPNAGGIGQSDHVFPSPLGAFTALRVGFVNPVTGVTTETVAAPPLVTGDRVEVKSGDFTVQVDIGIGGTSTIRILGVAGIDPQVDAKQHRKKRRYVVSNAPPIDLVTVIRAAGPTAMFNAALPANASVYTYVHLS